MRVNLVNSKEEKNVAENTGQNIHKSCARRIEIDEQMCEGIVTK